MGEMTFEETPQILVERGGPALQWEALRERVAARAQSPLGRELLRALEPSADLSWIESQQERAAEMRVLLGGAASHLSSAASSISRTRWRRLAFPVQRSRLKCSCA